MPRARHLSERRERRRRGDFLGLINTMAFYIVAHKDFANPAQLKGKKVGVSTLGSSSDFSLRYGLDASSALIRRKT